MTAVDVRPAADPGSWAHAARLLFGYHRETAVEVGAPQPRTPEEVWFPVRRETIDPASVHSTYLVAYEQGRPVGGIVLVAHDALSVLLKRCYVPPAQRRRGVATALVATAGDLAADRGATRLVLDVLPSRAGAIAAWRRMGFAEAPPWGDPAMAYFERPVAEGDGQWGRYLAVRDRLRSDPEARRAYAAAKRELARRFPADRGAYTAAKAPMLETLVGTACPTAPERQ